MLITFLCLLFPAWIYAQEITVPFPGGESMEFVWIEPGTFLMGTSEEWKEKWDEENSHWSEFSSNRIPYSREFPQHQVTITKGFYLGKREVNRSQWFAIMDPDQEVRAPAPLITKITFFDIQEYLNRLNNQSGRTFRLPTEAEWEYAARAGTTTLWWFGDTWKDRTPGPNPWGLFNMVGGAWEFTSDAMRLYADQSEIDPISPYRPHPGGRVMLRGGDNGGYQSLVEWPTHPYYTRSAYRMSISADFTMLSFGFRILLEGDNPTAIEKKSWGKIKAELN